MGLSKTEIPEKLTLEWIDAHSHIRLVGANHRWVVMAWRNVLFLKISDVWTPADTDDYVNRLSALPGILSEQWDTIFLVFDLSRMKFRVEDAFRYLRANWLKFLDREEMKICIVDESNIRRIALRSLYKLIGKLDKIRIFHNCNESLKWVREAIINSTPII
jgi:hypothetical protein